MQQYQYQMAKEGQLPDSLQKQLIYQRGLFVTVMVSALLIVFLNLLQIAAVGSITVLFIHATQFSHLKVKEN
jgi:hypothetical protein